MKRAFTQSEIDFIKSHYPEHGAAWCANRIGKTRMQVSNFAKRNNLKRIDYYHDWTDAEIKKLEDEFPHRKTELIAGDLGLTYHLVSNKAYQMGLKKTEAFTRSAECNRLDGIKGMDTRFKKGHISHNKWKKMSKELYEKVKHTFFKPGHTPATTKFFGKPYLHTRKRKDGYIEKVWFIQESANKRSAYLSYLCRINGIDLAGKVPVLRSGFDNSRPPTIQDIEVITYEENMSRNSLYRYPEELVNLIKVKAALKRQINKQNKDE